MYGMDGIVHGHEGQAQRRAHDVAMPAEQQHGDVMVPERVRQGGLAERVAVRLRIDRLTRRGRGVCECVSVCLCQ